MSYAGRAYAGDPYVGQGEVALYTVAQQQSRWETPTRLTSADPQPGVTTTVSVDLWWSLSLPNVAKPSTVRLWDGDPVPTASFSNLSSGVTTVVTQGVTAETIVPGMDATGLAAVPTRVQADLWTSTSRSGVLKGAVMRLYDGAPGTGTVLKSVTVPDAGDQSDGHRTEMLFDAIITPTSGRICATVQQTAGAPTIFADTRWLRIAPNAYATLVASQDFAAPPGDSTGGHQLEWVLSGKVYTPTTSKLTTTLQVTGPGAATVYSDYGQLRLTQPPGAAATIIGGTATETDTARAGTVTKGSVTKVGGAATETDTARAGAVFKRQNLAGGRAAEADVARAGSVTVGPRTITGGRAAEGDSARAGAASIARAPVTLAGGRVVEVSFVRAGTLASGALSRIVGGRVVEVESARHGVASTGAVAVGTHRWTLIDPSRGETYEFPLNPNKMTTPHSPRSFNIIATAPSGALTGGSRQGLGRVVELSREPFEWTFSGRIKTEAQYEELLRWSNKVNRLQVTDHLGRTWSIRVLAFNPNELIPTQRTPWRYEYDLKALNYGLVT